MKKLLHLAALPVLIACCTLPLDATNIKGGETVTISTPVDGNLYIGAGTVDISAKISGDVLAAGGEIYVRDSILEDAALGGGKIDIAGVIADDLRLGGGQVFIRRHVGGDLVIGGGDVVVEEGVVIGGDLMVAGGSVKVFGDVQGNVHLTGGDIGFFGDAENSFYAKAGKLLIAGNIRGASTLVADDIELGEQARFYRDVNYWQNDGLLEFDNKLMEGASAIPNAQLRETGREFSWQHFGLGAALFWILRLLAAAVTIALLVWLFSSFFAQTVEIHHREYLRKFGAGILFLLAAPIALALVFVTVIGIPVALTGLAIYGVAVCLSHILAAIIGAFELSRRSTLPWSKGKLALAAIGLFALLKLVVIIPFLGWLVALLATCVALGSLWLAAVVKRNRMEAA